MMRLIIHTVAKSCTTLQQRLSTWAMIAFPPKSRSVCVETMNTFAQWEATSRPGWSCERSKLTSYYHTYIQHARERMRKGRRKLLECISYGQHNLYQTMATRNSLSSWYIYIYGVRVYNTRKERRGKVSALLECILYRQHNLYTTMATRKQSFRAQSQRDT